MQPSIVVLALAATTAAFGQQADGIGYATVAAALEALRARSDVTISDRDGWTVINDHSSRTIWSFAPASHPAHPTVIRQVIVPKPDGAILQMSMLCEATTVVCAKAMALFRERNEQMNRELHAATQAAPESEIGVEGIDDASFRLTLKSYRSRTLDAAQTEMLAKAADVCGGRPFEYGPYKFRSQGAIPPSNATREPFVLEQEVQCGVVRAPSSAASKRNELSQWGPTTSQVQLVQEQTRKYFSVKDAGKYDEAYSLFSPRNKGDLQQWSSSAENFNAKAGAVRYRKIKKITWYKDPPNADEGIYAAVDFASQFTNIDIHCGYIVWHEQRDGSFLLIREEEGYIDRDTERSLKPDVLQKARAQLGC